MATLRRNTTPDGRYYIDPITKTAYPSVTTILDVGPKPWMKTWVANQVTKYAVENKHIWEQLDPDAAVDLIKREPLRFTNRAAGIGDIIHKTIESDRTDVPVEELAPRLQGYYRSFQQFITDHNPEYLHVEAIMLNRKYGYAGTVDGIVRIHDTLAVIDNKTGKSVHAEAALQLAAYARAEFIETSRGLIATPRIQQGYVLHLRPRGYKLHPVDISKESFETFLNLLYIQKWFSDQAQYVIGEPV